MKRVASPGSMHDTGCLGLVRWDDPEGWYGEGGGSRVQDGKHMFRMGNTSNLWQIHFDIWQNQYNIVKLNKIKLKKKKLNIHKTKIMASGPITSWEIDGETVETVSDFILGGSKNHCRW